ncbi:hypothetical protein TrVFT333_004743 [Trichoderma virens FT-333]|nr:hypothetical protein TrVFT333_004743 [Trichoderma virens FT-333]
MAQIGSSVYVLAISGTVFENLAFRYLKDAIGDRGFTDAQLHGAIAGTQSQILDHESEEVRDLALTAVIKAMGIRVYILVIVAGAVCVIGAAGMRSEKLFMKPSAGERKRFKRVEKRTGFQLLCTRALCQDWSYRLTKGPEATGTI